MKKYKYIRIDDIEDYDGWEIVKIIPISENANASYCASCCMAIIMKEDKPVQEVYLSKATNQELIEEFKKRLGE